MTTAILFYCLLAVTLAADTTQFQNQIKASFDLIDTNHDGDISLTEFYQIYDKYDTDGDGHIHLAEYIASTSIPKDQATPAFNSYDLNKDGDISRSEVKPIFDQFDANDPEGDAGWSWKVKHRNTEVMAVSSIQWQ